ncbi:hypothetical protein [Actinokineospora sp. NBRC 105648]|uniref:hypothetical protein n=1 Tax=Actinokineospora sp. NBRC 105648 TaxID=3032206 RepID=UPI0025562308|nr:hypothetical protein [Actinokineospora sp. NBRC 105648]
MALALVHDLREQRTPWDKDDLAALYTDVLSEFVLARASAGLTTAPFATTPATWS